MEGQWIISPVETQYVIQFKESDGVTGIVIPADRAEIKTNILFCTKMIPSFISAR